MRTSFSTNGRKAGDKERSEQNDVEKLTPGERGSQGSL
jgi:hypothetical protein